MSRSTLLIGGNTGIGLAARGDSLTVATRNPQPIKAQSLAKILHVIKRLATAQKRANGNDQKVHQLVVHGAVDSRVW